jgi:hypothetical protein
VNDPIPSAAERNHALPAAVDDVLRRALAKDRAKRPASCRVLIESTRSALGLGRPTDRHGSPRLPIVTAAVAGVATAALLAAVWIGRGDAPRGAATANAGSIVRIDPATASVGARQTVATRPTAVAMGDPAGLEHARAAGGRSRRGPINLGARGAERRGGRRRLRDCRERH